MKKIIVSALISLCMAALMFTTLGICYGAQESDYDWSPKFPDQYYVSESVSATVYGDYNPGSNFYHARFVAARGFGQANGYNGYLWYWWTQGSQVIEWYNTGSLQDENGATECGYLKAESYSGFYRYVNGQLVEWYRYAVAGPITT